MMGAGLMRWFHTVRYLRPVQIYGRIWRRLYRPAVDFSSPPAVRPGVGGWVLPAQRKSFLLSPFVFHFLNEEHALVDPKDWDDPAVSKLWRYNLHYFDDLNAEEYESRTRWHRELLQRWLEDNPPARGTGWEPYPTSLRIVNWIKWALAGNALSPECLHSLAIQVRWLGRRLETHLLGNHLFANAKALVFSGLFFCGPEAEKWFEMGMQILSREIPEQILADGGQFERSTMYHSLALEDMLDLCNLAASFQQAVPECWLPVVKDWRQVVERMGYWAAVMRHPDGEIGFFNDAAFDIAPSPEALDEYASRLGFSLVSELGDGVKHLEKSGYIRLQQREMTALLDVAQVGPDYLPGHAHADTLSFELSLFGQRVFVNSGTSCYGVGKERSWQRSTAAHNTVVVDGQDSSEVWSGFRVARRARPSVPVICKQAFGFGVEASHDGYRFLPGRNIHRRQWCYSDYSLEVTDEVTGSFLEAESRYYLHPDVLIGHCELNDGGAVLSLPQGQEVEIFVQEGTLQVLPATWHPFFGVSRPNHCLAIKFRSSKVKIVFAWSGGIV